VWIEGGKLARSGYRPEDRYNITVVDKKIILTRTEEGGYCVTRRQRNGRTHPLIDLTSARCGEMLAIFSVEQLIRIVVTEHVITITQHHIDLQSKLREERLVQKLKHGEPLSVCAQFFGYGTLDRAAHDGLAAAGIKTRLSVLFERDCRYIDPALEMYGDMVDKDTVIVESPIQLARVTGQQQADITVIGLPCTGASKAGKAKNKIKNAEDHPDAGAMFYYYLKIVELMNSAIIVFENVCDYLNTEGMSVIRSVLATLGYELVELTLSGNDFGSIEDRRRMCVFAVSRNLRISDFPINDILFSLTSPSKCKLSNVLDDISVNDPLWKRYDYLADKELKDKAAGKGFKRQLLSGDENKCGTIGRGYNRARSTEPFIQHPTDPSLSRLLTVSEHARVKGYPEVYLNPNMPTTVAHEALGQGVVYPAFKTAFEVLGMFLHSLISSRSRTVFAA
jgi:DNA (cytosine-5)-methyltransferase 1